MDIEKYTVLVNTINCGSFSAVAEDLGYTPSGISRIIKSIEQETGFPLLVRDKYGVTPTKECELLLPHIHALIKSAINLEQKINQISNVEVGTITIGTAYNAYFPWISKLIYNYTRIHPGINFNLVEDTSSNLARMVETGEADFCIISKREGNLDWIQLDRDELVACVPLNHPSVKRGYIENKEIAQEPFIELYPDRDTDNSRFISKALPLLSKHYSTSDPYAVFAMVEAGLGISLANRMFAESIQSNTSLVSLNPSIFLEVGIVTAVSEKISPITKSFLKFAKNYIDAI